MCAHKCCNAWCETDGLYQSEVVYVRIANQVFVGVHNSLLTINNNLAPLTHMTWVYLPNMLNRCPASEIQVTASMQTPETKKHD